MTKGSDWYMKRADMGMQCRWGDGRGSSGEGNEVIAGKMGVAGSELKGEKSKGHLVNR